MGGEGDRSMGFRKGLSTLPLREMGSLGRFLKERVGKVHPKVQKHKTNPPVPQQNVSGVEASTESAVCVGCRLLSQGMENRDRPISQVQASFSYLANSMPTQGYIVKKGRGEKRTYMCVCSGASLPTTTAGRTRVGLEMAD